MKWNYKKIVLAAILLPAGMCCGEAAAEELSSEAAAEENASETAAEELSWEETEIIDEIVNTKIKEARGGNIPAEIQNAIDTIYPVITKDTPESSAFIKKLEEQAEKKYPASDKELDAKYRRLAESDYPLYKVGDNITVTYRLYGKSFTVSGPYYRQDSKFVWVGSKKINKLDLEREHASRFDPILVKQVRENYVIQHVRSYQQERNNDFTRLKNMNGEKIYELRGSLPAYKKRMAARKTAEEKYLMWKKKMQETFNSAVEMSKKSKLKAFSMMEEAVQKYDGTPEAKKGKKLLAEWKPAVEKEREERRQAEERRRQYEEHRQRVYRETGHYPCRACGGSGRSGGSFDPRYGYSSSTCNACGGRGLE